MNEDGHWQTGRSPGTIDWTNMVPTIQVLLEQLRAFGDVNGCTFKLHILPWLTRAGEAMFTFNVSASPDGNIVMTSDYAWFEEGVVGMLHALEVRFADAGFSIP